MEECRCTFTRYRASSRYSRRPSVNLGLHDSNLGCTWTSMTDRNRRNKRNSAEKQSLRANETGHWMSPCKTT